MLGWAVSKRRHQAGGVGGCWWGVPGTLSGEVSGEFDPPSSSSLLRSPYPSKLPGPAFIAGMESWPKNPAATFVQQHCHSLRAYAGLFWEVIKSNKIFSLNVPVSTLSSFPCMILILLTALLGLIIL